MNDLKLDFWIKNNYNVLFQGKHGTGKTTRIIEAFNRNNLKWKYFSAATLDPWVDFVGVPKEVKDENGMSYLDLIRPKCFAEDEVEAIFMDEYNRSNQKVRNATMELIQFKSINGKRFNNLRFIWAAVNPDKELDNDDSLEYDVDKIDPAQKDRFEIHVDVPYKPEHSYFKQKYGPDIGKVSIDWWHELNDKEKDLVSPRRLDYALDIYTKGGDMRDILNNKLNVAKLIQELKNGSYRARLEVIFKEKNDEDAKKFVSDENNYNSTIKYITTNKSMLDYFFKFFPEEKQCSLISTDEVVLKYTMNQVPSYKDILNRVALSNKKVSTLLNKYNSTIVVNIPLEKLTFTSKALHFKTSPKIMNVSIYSSYTDMVNRESATAGRGTAYRKNLYNLMAWYFYNNFNYKNALIKTKGASLQELELTLKTLNDIITSTYSFDNFRQIEILYGMVCHEYSVFGKKQDYSKLGRKVQDFITKYAALYI